MKLKQLLFLLILALFITSCSNKAPYTNRSQLILISNEKELALGEQSYKEALKESKVITNTREARRVKEVGRRISRVANKNYKWEFNLVENKAKNAFCLPGGKVVVYSGIFEVAKNDDQLATVISHEIAHALARHGAERMSQSMISQGIQTVGNLVISTQAPEFTNTFNVAYGLGSQYGVLMPYGRMQESEADEIGVYLMYNII